MEVHSREEKRSKWNSVLVGFGVALVVPMIVFVFYWYLTLYPQFTLAGMFKELTFDRLLTIFSLCASPNLLVVLLFTRRNWNEAAKGMILAILLLIIVSVFTKL